MQEDRNGGCLGWVGSTSIYPVKCAMHHFEQFLVLALCVKLYA